MDFSYPKVLFYSPNSLLAAISKYKKSAIYIELSEKSLPLAFRKRSNPELCREILSLIGARHSVHELHTIKGFLLEQDSPNWVIEMSLLQLLDDISLDAIRDRIQGLQIGADPFCAKITSKTILAGKKAWKESIEWKKALSAAPVSSFLFYDARNGIRRLVKLPVKRITTSQIEDTVLSLSLLSYMKEIPVFRNQTGKFVVFGVNDDEYNIESNIKAVKNCLERLNLREFNIVIKPHPNFSGDLRAAISKVENMVMGKAIEEAQIADKLIPLELLIYSKNCLHYFGVPSSALMVYPKERFTLMTVSPPSKELFRRSYLNSGI